MLACEDEKNIFFNSPLLAPDPDSADASLHIQNFLMPAAEQNTSILE